MIQAPWPATATHNAPIATVLIFVLLRLKKARQLHGYRSHGYGCHVSNHRAPRMPFSTTSRTCFLYALSIVGLPLKVLTVPNGKKHMPTMLSRRNRASTSV